MLMMKRKSEYQVPPDLDRLLTAEEVAAVLGISVRSLRRWRELGRLPPPVSGCGVRLKWHKSLIEKFIAQLGR